MRRQITSERWRLSTRRLLVGVPAGARVGVDALGARLATQLRDRDPVKDRFTRRLPPGCSGALPARRASRRVEAGSGARALKRANPPSVNRLASPASTSSSATERVLSSDSWPSVEPLWSTSSLSWASTCFSSSSSALICAHGPRAAASAASSAGHGAGPPIASGAPTGISVGQWIFASNGHSTPDLRVALRIITLGAFVHPLTRDLTRLRSPEGCSGLRSAKPIRSTSLSKTSPTPSRCDPEVAEPGEAGALVPRRRRLAVDDLRLALRSTRCAACRRTVCRRAVALELV